MQTPPIHETSPATTRWPHLVTSTDRITWVAGENPTSPKTCARPNLAPYLHLPGAVADHQKSMLTAADYDLALIEKHARLRESEGEGQSETPGLPVEALHVWVVTLLSLIATAYGLHRFTSFGGGLTSSLSVAVAVVAFFLWWWVESHHLNKKKTAWERRVHDHNQTRDQLVADGTLIPLDALATEVRHDAGMGEDFDRAEAYAAKSGQTHETSELTTHVLDFWTRHWARTAPTRRELAEVDEILDTAPDRYESDAIRQVRQRRETLAHELMDTSSDTGLTASEEQARQADQKAEKYLARQTANGGQR